MRLEHLVDMLLSDESIGLSNNGFLILYLD